MSSILTAQTLARDTMCDSQAFEQVQHLHTPQTMGCAIGAQQISLTTRLGPNSGS